MRIVCFIDLDDTFLQTAPKCPAGEPVTPAAVDRTGRVISFMTAKQERLLRLLSEAAELVPATGRSVDALARVHLRFSSFTITNHGATVTGRDGLPHRPWVDEVFPALETRRPQLEAAVEQVRRWATELGVAARIEVIFGYGVPTYVSVKCENSESMATLAAAIDLSVLGAGLRIHLLGRNLALLPAETSKRRAVAHVIATLRAEDPRELLTLGFGDSLTDAPFLGECDFATTPRTSQIVQALRQLTGIEAWV